MLAERMNQSSSHPLDYEQFGAVVTITMETLPNEVLEIIVSYLDEKDIPKLRLVSHRFNQLATRFVQSHFRVDFHQVCDVIKYVSVFEQSQTSFLFQKFGFEDDLLNEPMLAEPLNQFCSKFGKFVKTWEILYSGFSPERQDVFSRNIETLLENCENVEEFNHFTCGIEMGENAITPVLNNLRTINITFIYRYVETVSYPDHYFPVLDQFLKLAPNLHILSVDSSQLDLPLVTNLLDQVRMTRPHVNLKLIVSMWVPARGIHDVENFVTIAKQLKIFELSLTMYARHVDIIGAESVCQTLCILAMWLEELTFVSKLAVIVTPYAFSSHRHEAVGYSVSLPLQSLPNLANLEIFGLRIQEVKCKQLHFLTLTRLSCQNCVITKNSSFFECIFPNVKCAQIDLITDDEIQQWPSILPNVEDLKVTSETLEGIFGFSKLRKLNITIRVSHRNPAVSRLHWKFLTGGAKYIPDNQICNFPLQIHKSSEFIASFRNLPLLSELSFSRENIDCWKAVIHASRTGELRRLQRLDFSFIELFELKNQYREVLLQYHDNVNVINAWNGCVIDDASTANQLHCCTIT